MGKFEKFNRSNRIPEWRDYYINYKFLASILKKIKKFNKKTTTILLEELISNITTEEFNYIENLKNDFKTNFLEETEKFNTFFKFVYNNSIKIKFFKIILNLKTNEKKHFSFKKKSQNQKKIKEATERYYKEISHLRWYVNLNIKIIYKLQKTYKKIMSELQIKDKDFIEDHNEMILNSYFFQNAHKLKKMSLAVERIYIDEFFPKELSKRGKIELEKILKNKQFTTKEAVTLGLYLGFFISALIGTIFLLNEVEFFSDKKNDFVSYQIPIFRGSLIVFLYFFFLGLNVYIWEKCNINYKRVFNIQLHHSSAYQIFKRVCFFLSVWMVIFMYSAMCFIYNGENLSIFSKELEIYLPPITWLFFLIYLLFPSNKIFNPKGRIYFFKLVRDIFFSFFRKTKFLVPWATDQMLSLVIPLKDLSYTICYSFNVFNTGKMQNTCYKYPFKYIEFIIIFLPLFLRFIQCLRKAYDYEDKSHSFYQIVNAGKYLTSIIMTIFSVFQKLSQLVYWLWISFLLLSTLYCYIWDLKKDFGFLQMKSKYCLLRNKLYYPQRWFYYLAIIVNLGLRFTWTLTISPNSLNSVLFSVVITSGLGILETFRRTLWNYFRVELENLKYECDYSTVQGFILPFGMDVCPNDQNMKGFINKIIENKISELNFNPNNEFLINKNFRLDDWNTYAKNYQKMKKIKSNGKKYKLINRSLDEEDLKNFQSKYQYKIDSMEKKIKIKEEKRKSKENNNKLSMIQDGEPRLKTLMNSFNQPDNFEIKTPLNSFLIDKLKDEFNQVVRKESNFNLKDVTLLNGKKDFNEDFDKKFKENKKIRKMGKIEGGNNLIIPDEFSFFDSNSKSEDDKEGNITAKNELLLLKGLSSTKKNNFN